jgi:hypothetical protein
VSGSNCRQRAVAEPVFHVVSVIPPPVHPVDGSPALSSKYRPTRLPLGYKPVPESP